MNEIKITLDGQYGKVATVGRLGEHDVNQLVIDFSYYTDLYGEMSASVVATDNIKKSGYPIASIQNGNTLTIQITKDFTYAKRLYLEIHLRNDEGLAKSEIVTLNVRDALPDATGHPPMIFADWITKAEELLNDLDDTHIGLTDDGEGNITIDIEKPKNSPGGIFRKTFERG